MKIQVPANFNPRPYQLPFLNAMDEGKRRACLVWHRKSGKSTTLLNFTIKKAFERVGVYYHAFPEYGQGRKIIWDGIDNDGNRMLDYHVPKEIRTSTNRQEMKIDLVNGSIYQIIGADNYDSLVGPNPMGLILDEWAVSNRYPIAWDYFRPILAQNRGWAVFVYTPRGLNHGYELHEMARKNPAWYSELLTVDDTKAISLEAIQAERDSGMPEYMIRQEFYCDFVAVTGQAFRFTQGDHVVDGAVIPEYAQMFMTFDWGYGAPFSVGWWWVDADNRLYRFNEWYGWNGTANQGLRMTDIDIAEGIKQREEKMGIWGRPIIRKAGPDCFNKKPDYKGGGQGPSTAEEFRKIGLELTPGDANRKLKIRQFRERLKIPVDGRPMLQVYKGCTQFIRTIPLLQSDPNDIEDVDTNGEDHIYDEACHIVMARPLTRAPEVKVVRRPPKDATEVAELERKQIFREVLGQAEDYPW